MRWWQSAVGTIKASTGSVVVGPRAIEKGGERCDGGGKRRRRGERTCVETAAAAAAASALTLLLATGPPRERGEERGRGL